MRTKVLLIIEIYYLTFILITALLTYIYGGNGLVFIFSAPILSLIHGNFTDAILYLIIFSDVLTAIFHVILPSIKNLEPDINQDLKKQHRLLIIKHHKEYIKNIYHPPENLTSLSI